MLIASAPLLLRKHEEYDESCKVGFETFFDGLWKFHPDGTSTQRQEPYTYVEAITEVAENLTPDGLEQPPFAFGVGFTLGWLSALALSDRELAHQGLEITRLQVSQRLKEMCGR
ncbi:hypothetical protein [Ktedonospora formicarum]|uniref:Uncharacterized protein n=1 Tax=Ktedonospora formicarum TaxID=2778364 RepID=A0A8J3HUU1_9CHLR|nr:hypothetical protein [Ktedonospora formicarum]GHO44447.1 hypothetical protein KSX_26100 [Ktedonospora formicarum]